jgi:hypothetical protein
MFFLFNPKTKQIYKEPCLYDGKLEIVGFDSISTAQKHKPSKAWSVADWRTCFYQDCKDEPQ